MTLLTLLDSESHTLGKGKRLIVPLFSGQKFLTAAGVMMKTFFKVRGVYDSLNFMIINRICASLTTNLLSWLDNPPMLCEHVFSFLFYLSYPLSVFSG